MPDEANWKFGRADLWVLLLLTILVVWTFRLIIAGTHAPIMSSLRDAEPWNSQLTEADLARPESFANDPTTQTYSWTIYAHENLQKGDFPLWNTRMYSGTPFVANRLTGLYDPLVLIPVWLLPPMDGLSVFYFIHYLLAAWFFYLFLKSLEISRPAAAFGAIAYIFQGAYVPWMGFIVADKCYLPMSFYYLQRILDRKDRAGITGFILSFWALTITSYPQMIVFAIYLFFPWVLFTRGPGVQAALKRGLGLAIMLVLIFLIGAMQHLPTAEFFLNSLRAQPDFNMELESMTRLEQFDSPLSLLAIYFPTLWGDYLGVTGDQLPVYIQQIYNHAYIGILAAFAFLFFPVVWKNRYAKFFTITAVIGLVFIAWHWFYMLAVKVMPGMRISTIKPNFIALTAMIIVGCFVLDYFLKHLRNNPEIAAKFIRVFGWILGVIVGLGAVVIAAKFIPAAAADRFWQARIIFIGLLFVWGAGLLLYFHARGKIALKWVIAGILAIQIADLIPYHEHFMPLVPKDRVAFVTPGIEFLMDKMQSDGPFRVFRDRFTVIPPNMLMIYDLDEPGGFDSFVSSDYAHFFRSIDPAMSRNSRTIDLPSDYIYYHQPFWAFLGIRYLLFPGENRNLPPPWEEAYSGDLYVYENPYWQKRWFLVPKIIPVQTKEDGYAMSQAFDPRAEAVVEGIKIEDIPPELLQSWEPAQSATGMEIPQPGTIGLKHYGADDLQLSVNTVRDSYLVFSDTYFPGWRAYVDGKEVAIYRTNGIIKGIVVPEGLHEVKFIYDPVSYKIGYALALLGLIMIPFMLKPVVALYAE